MPELSEIRHCMTLIRTENLNICLGGVTILKDVSFEIARGEIVTLVGPNGSGKSTLLRALIGVLPQTSGQVSQMPGLRIGYVPQKLDIDPTLPLTVKRFLNLPKQVPDPQMTAALNKTGAGALTTRQMSALSGGQFQRVLLARALLTQPDILILDEATRGLDQPGSAAFYRLIETLRQEVGCAVLMVSHELHVVMAASDRVICLNGHICCQGAPEQVASAPAYRALFGKGTQGALALYRHEHNHTHDHGCDHQDIHESTE